MKYIPYKQIFIYNTDFIYSEKRMTTTNKFTRQFDFNNLVENIFFEPESNPDQEIFDEHKRKGDVLIKYVWVLLEEKKTTIAKSYIKKREETAQEMANCIVNLKIVKKPPTAKNIERKLLSKYGWHKTEYIINYVYNCVKNSNQVLNDFEEMLGYIKNALAGYEKRGIYPPIVVSAEEAEKEAKEQQAYDYLFDKPK